jgi:hypothetical protein
MLTRRRFLRTALWLPPVLVVGTGCSGATSGVKATLDQGWPPALGGVFSLRLTATSSWSAPKPNADGTKTTAAEVYFSLMDGLALLEPLEPQWVMSREVEHFTFYKRQVTFVANGPLSFDFQVRLDQPGDLRLLGGAIVAIQGAPHSYSETLYLRVTPAFTIVQRTPFSRMT